MMGPIVLVLQIYFFKFCSRLVGVLSSDTPLCGWPSLLFVKFGWSVIPFLFICVGIHLGVRFIQK